MRLSDFDFSLPPELIAQQPLADRAGARMLVVDRAAGSVTDCMFRDLPQYVRASDCLVLNDTRVFPSRLLGFKVKGDGGEGSGSGSCAAVEVFLTKQVANSAPSSTWNESTGPAATSRETSIWQAMVRPGKRVRVGDHIRISDELSIEVLDRGEFGERTVRLLTPGDVYAVLERLGHVPLPPYIHREDTTDDHERYQTVFARERGSVAAPTAGLHFTPEVLAACRAMGASVAHVTLHVGLGTFAPLRTDVIEEVRLHHEEIDVPEAAVAAMNAAIHGGGRVIGVGTTSVRAIESPPGARETDLFISPGFRFARTGAMLTNFHLPQSSLLVLVCAFAGRELTLEAYSHAVRERYRFFSYGDCMLII